MGFPLPELPELSWFEIEILYHLMEEERYGNELMAILNSHLGDDAVSSGKLYPVLKKLEKAGLISRIKKKKGPKGEGKSSGSIPFLTRGVDRVYFEITKEGRVEIDKAVNYATGILWNRISGRLDERVSTRISEIIDKIGKKPMIGVTVPDRWADFDRALKMLKDHGYSNMFFLPMSRGRRRDLQINPDRYSMDITHFPSSYGDIPLKSEYLDIVISTVHLAEISDRDEHLREIIRIIKPGGHLIIVDYGKFDSYLLEDIFSRHVEIDSDRKYKGEGIEDTVDLLEDHLDNMKITRIKEMFIISGRRI